MTEATEALTSNTHRPQRRSVGPVLAVILTGSAVAIGLGVYGSLHDPTGRSLPSTWFSSTESLKAWLTTIAVAMMAVQVMTGIGMRRSGSLLPQIHRLTGTIAFAITLPVVFHCLWALGLSTPNARTAIHSLLGCAAYGAYASKIVAVRRSDAPAWLVPAAGAVLMSLFVAIWWTGARWYFSSVSWGL